MDINSLMAKCFQPHAQLPCQAAFTLLPPLQPVFTPRVAPSILSPSIRDLKMNRTSCYFSTASGHSSSDAVPDFPSFDIGMLEKYTEKVQSELLLVHAVVDGEEDEVLVFKGHSSSLMRPTASDPGEPVLPPAAVLNCIDRIRAPFNPSNPQYIKQGLSWDEFLDFLNLRDF